MKKNSGVTMIILAVTVTVMLILSATIINISTESYNVIKEQNFLSKMEIIQAKVDEIAEEGNNNIESDEISEKNDDNEKSQKKEFQGILDEITELNEELKKIENYKYFKKNTLDEKLGIKDIDMDVIIDFENRKVISIEGVTIKGTTYHMQEELKNKNK